MFGLLIRAQLFGYVYLILTCINKPVFEQNLLELGSKKQVFNSLLYYLMFAYVIIYPINVCLFLFFMGPEGLQNKRVKSYFGTLYDGLNESHFINVQAVTLFITRRLIIGISIAFYRRYYFLQL